MLTPEQNTNNQGEITAQEHLVTSGTSMDDAMFNEFILLGLDFFDAVILAQSCTVGNLLTEDLKLMHLKDTGVKIINWAALQTGMGVEV